jgi:hypothetical protein
VTVNASARIPDAGSSSSAWLSFHHANVTTCAVAIAEVGGTGSADGNSATCSAPSLRHDAQNATMRAASVASSAGIRFRADSVRTSIPRTRTR